MINPVKKQKSIIECLVTGDFNKDFIPNTKSPYNTKDKIYTYETSREEVVPGDYVIDSLIGLAIVKDEEDKTSLRNVYDFYCIAGGDRSKIQHKVISTNNPDFKIFKQNNVKVVTTFEMIVS